MTEAKELGCRRSPSTGRMTATIADVHTIVHKHLSGGITVAHSFFDKGARRRLRDPSMRRQRDAVARQRPGRPARVAGTSSHRLDALTRFLGVRHRHHGALSDARAVDIVVLRAIQHTGIELAGWLSPAVASRARAPKAADTGPLYRERIAILSAPRDGSLAQWLAAAGARVMASVGTTTTRLVIGDERPFGRFFTAHADHRRAEKLR